VRVGVLWVAYCCGRRGAPATRQHPGAWTTLVGSAAVAESIRPVAGVDYPSRLAELRSWFPADADCVDYLDWLRWPDGFACPGCGAGRGWLGGDGRRRCQGGGCP
jgi:hypothetical protein